jgi:transcription elongation factor Elf1
MSDVAIKFGQESRMAPGSVQLGTLTCDVCGTRFAITQDAQHQDTDAAERQASWLEKRLAEDHENGFEHEDAIDLPGFAHR